jgi:hypothetical protein
MLVNLSLFQNTYLGLFIAGHFMTLSSYLALNGSRSRSYFTTDGRSVSISWCRVHSETCDKMLLPVGRLLSESCGRVFAGCPLWREAGSVNVEVEVTLRLTDSQSVSMTWYRAPLWDLRPDIIPVGMLLSESCGLVSTRRPLWREDGSAAWSVLTQWSESFRTRNHTLLSHLRLPQTGGPGSRVYIPQEKGWRSYTPGHWDGNGSIVSKGKIVLVLN